MFCSFRRIMEKIPGICMQPSTYTQFTDAMLSQTRKKKKKNCCTGIPLKFFTPDNENEYERGYSQSCVHTGKH